MMRSAFMDTKLATPLVPERFEVVTQSMEILSGFTGEDSTTRLGLEDWRQFRCHVSKVKFGHPCGFAGNQLWTYKRVLPGYTLFRLSLPKTAG